jgi:hypothetical protein
MSMANGKRALPATGTFEFVNFAHPVRSDEQRKKVRAHAAKNSALRQQRVIQYQRSRQVESGTIKAVNQPRLVDDGFFVMQRLPPGPKTLLGAGRIDPFSSFVRPLSVSERMLLDHCKYAAFLNSRLYLLDMHDIFNMVKLYRVRIISANPMT